MRDGRNAPMKCPSLIECDALWRQPKWVGGVVLKRPLFFLRHFFLGGFRLPRENSTLIFSSYHSDIASFALHSASPSSIIIIKEKTKQKHKKKEKQGRIKGNTSVGLCGCGLGKEQVSSSFFSLLLFYTNDERFSPYWSRASVYTVKRGVGTRVRVPRNWVSLPRKLTTFSICSRYPPPPHRERESGVGAAGQTHTVCVVCCSRLLCFYRTRT